MAQVLQIILKYILIRILGIFTLLATQFLNSIYLFKSPYNQQVATQLIQINLQYLNNVKRQQFSLRKVLKIFTNKFIMKAWK